MTTKGKLALIAILLATLSGCASYGPDINQQAVSRIQEGVTSKSDLISMFGAPMNTMRNSDGTTVLAWGSSRSGFMYSDMQSQGLSVILGPDNKVVSYSHSAMQL